jgi:microcystin-dependent protein
MTIGQFNNFKEKADKITGGTNNNIVTRDADGNIQDSGNSVANVLDRTNHTGSQAISTITDLQTNLDAKVLISNVVNDLISTDTDKPLSALQGKNLLDSVFATQDIMAYKVPSPTNNNFVKHDSNGDIADAGVSAVSFNGANQVVKLDANGKLESIDGSALTNVSASQPRGSYVTTIATSVTGAIACDGSSYSKTTYSDLYALITAELGANALEDSGNSSNFVIPNLEGRVIGVAGGGRNLFDLVGSDTHTLTTNEIPSHSHGYSKGYYPGYASGSATNAGAGYFWGYTTGTTSNAGGGAAHSIVQKTSYIAKKIFIFY